MFKYRKRLFISLLMGLTFFSSFAEALIPNAPGSYVGISKLSNTSVRISTKDNSDNEDGFYALLYDYKTSELVQKKEISNSNNGYVYADFTDLVCDKLYSTNVLAFNEDGNSSVSNTRYFNIHSTFSTPCSVYTAPIGTPATPGPYIGVTDIDKTSVRVNFLDNANNEDGFLLFDESGDINITVPKNNKTAPSQTSVTLTGLRCNKTYTLKALAFNNNGNSATSNERVFNIHSTFGVPCGDIPEEIDTTKPVITLLGDKIVTLTVGDTYTDAGATATDNKDGNITSKIKVTGLPINTSAEGNYTVTYSVSDKAGNIADVVTRKVIVNYNVLTKEEPLVPANCLGHITKSGVDINGNGVLDEDEVTSTEEHYDEGTPITREVLITMIGNGDDVTQVNTCKITDMSNLFNPTIYSDEQNETVSNFNQDISGWNTSSVENMGGMFAHNTKFNQFIGDWNVSKVTNMLTMFWNAKTFNQELNNWDVSSVTDMSYMFYDTKKFNKPLDNWDTSSVENMVGMFAHNTKFNQPIGNWDVSKVTNMSEMFAGVEDGNETITTVFNQDISGWNTSRVENMEGMFAHNIKFNQPIGDWDVSKVTNMSTMFWNAQAFNKPLDSWDVSSVTSMSWMFADAVAFNQNISNWDISNVGEHDNFAYNPPLEDEHNPFYKEAVDTTKPVITLLGDSKVTLTIGDTYTDAGATATDDVDGNITSSILVTGLPIDTSLEGNYTVTYDVSDLAGNLADTVTRTVNVVVAPKHDYKVTLKTIENIAGYEIHLKFTDDMALESDVVVDNSFLGTTGRNVMNLGPNINSTTKEIKFGGFTFGTQEGVVGDFDIMTLKSSDSQSQITVSYKSCIDKDANEIACDIEIRSN